MPTFPPQSTEAARTAAAVVEFYTRPTAATVDRNELTFFHDTSDETIAAVVRAMASTGATFRVRFIEATA